MVTHRDATTINSRRQKQELISDQGSKMTLRSPVRGPILGLLLFATNMAHAAPDNAPTASTAVNASAAGALTRWQAALDQLAQGHRLEAKVLLEQARTRYGDAPEINMLLAWLAERDGQNVSKL